MEDENFKKDSVVKRFFFYKFKFSWFKILIFSLFILASVIVIANEAFYWIMDDVGYDVDVNAETADTADCNTSGILLRGELVTYITPDSYDADGSLLYSVTASEEVNYYIDQAENDSSIKAIILEVDSVGGSGVAAEEVANRLKTSSKPVVALIRDYAYSAAYWVATGADKIFASANSEVGSIGVTMSYIDEVNLNQINGYNYNQLSSGKFKDAGSVDKPLTFEERELFMRDVEIMHDNFVKVVAENRGLEIPVVEKLADGSGMLGQMAMDNGLIDQIGSEDEVKAYLAEVIGEPVEICWQ